MALKTYDPHEVTLNVNGVPITNWDEVTIEYEEDDWTFTTGTQGETTRTYNNNTFGTITILLPQSSDDNEALFGLNALGVAGPITIIDNSGDSIYEMLEGTLLRNKTAAFSKEHGQREWMCKGNIELGFTAGN